MVMTWILGAVVAVLCALGMKHIYSNFFKGTSTCCSGGGCSGCSPRGKGVTGDSYRQRVERIETYERRRSIDVGGMTCERCVEQVNRALEQVGGVALAAASLEKMAAQVALDREVSDETLKEAVRKAGYQPGECVPI